MDELEKMAVSAIIRNFEVGGHAESARILRALLTDLAAALERAERAEALVEYYQSGGKTMEQLEAELKGEDG